MYVPRVIDIDRLHHAVDLINCGHSNTVRRQGITVAYLMLMLGEAFTGPQANNYLYIGTDATVTATVLREFKRNIADHAPEGLAITRVTHHKCAVNAQQFFFYSIDELVANPLLLGIPLDRVFVDVYIDKQRRLDRSGQLSLLFSHLLLRVQERRGDIV